MAPLTIHLVTWNGDRYMPHLLESLSRQTYRNWELWVWDNHSQDDTLNWVEKYSSSFPCPPQIINSGENIGFACGHNRLYQRTDSPYFLLLNQDMYLPPDCLAKMMAFVDDRSRVAVASPRLMEWDFGALQKGVSLEESLTERVDSLGLRVLSSRQVFEVHPHREWAEISDEYSDGEREVFGVSGTLPLFSRADLDEVAFPDGTFFDEDHHTYKEDVDLAFRLRSAGKKAFIITDAVAYHDRTGKGAEERSQWALMKNKRDQPIWLKYYSYQNHLRVLYKNEYWQNFLLDFPWIFLYEMKKFFYYLLLERKVLRGVEDLRRSWKRAKEKRRWIVKQRKVSWRDMRRWWT